MQEGKTVELVEDSGIYVSKSGYRKCSRSSVSGFTTDLLTLVYTNEVLGMSSKTGKVSNFNKTKPPKEKLDPEKLAAIKSKLYVYFRDQSYFIFNSILL